MARRRTAGPLLGDTLNDTRRRTFVGRVAERALARTAFTTGEPPFTVMWLTGPGGIGKSSLLDVLADDATAAGAHVIRIDGRHVPPSADAFRAAFFDPFDGIDDGIDDMAALDRAASRTVLFVDAYERLERLDGWLREHFLPRLPASVVVVIASRNAPSTEWRADPAWREASRVVSLRNLDPEEGHAYLELVGIDVALHDRLVELSHGHPLGLSLLADVVAGGHEPAISASTPNLVETLVARFVDITPSAERRRALEVCALARVTDETMLRAALECDDATDTFTWLRSLSFVEVAADGIVPHDLARDVLDADLRWRDPDEYARVFRAVRRHVHERLRSAAGPRRRSAAFDLKFLFRNLPSVLSPVDWETWGSLHPEPATLDDHAAIVDLVERAEGPASATIAARWLAGQPGAFHVVRRDDGTPRGVIAVIELTTANPADVAADPGARAAWEHTVREGPPRAGETVTQVRFVVDGHEYQAPSPTMNATPIVTLLGYLDAPNLARDYITLRDPDVWDPFFELADFLRASDADFEVGGHRYGMFCHDFRRTPVDALIELWTERALAQDPTLRSAATATLVLSRSDFGDAVRGALRDLHRPDALTANPLTHTRLVLERPGAADRPAAALAELVHDAVTALAGDDAADDKLHRAVDRTYVRRAPTQEAAAEVLGLPFSTYRRHLTRGVEQLVEWLWERELYGKVAPDR